MEHPIFLFQDSHIIILLSTVNELSVFTNKFNFDAEVDATSAITISTVQT
jgi:hypothetical protein